MRKDHLFLPQLEDARRELEIMVQDELEDPRVIARGRMILACLQGQAMDDIAQDFGVSRSMIFRWRARFFQEGVSGLRDKPRCGKPPKYDQEFEKKVLNLLAEMPPEGVSAWDGPSLARHLSASNDAVWRVLRKYHISLARQREWNVDARLNLPRNFPVVAGIYIGPPVWIVTLTEGSAPLGSTQVITRESQAGRALHQAAQSAGGILPLQDAIRIMADQTEGLSADSTRRMEIIRFLDDTALPNAAGNQVRVHVVGSAVQLGIANWMAAHSEVTLFFHATLEDAVSAVRQFLPEYASSPSCPLLSQMADYPPRAHPFIWKKIRAENCCPLPGEA